MNREYKSVHDAHCCKKHGCTYGDGYCPVVDGDEDGIKCEVCEWEENDHATIELKAVKKQREVSLSLGKYYLWIGDDRYSSIHAKKRGRIALVKGDKHAKEIISKVNAHDALMDAIKRTLDDNAHLADGDVCTLKVLKDAYNSVADEMLG